MKGKNVSVLQSDRLIKVKDMLLKEAIEERREETARAARTFGSSGEAPQEV